MSHLLNTKNQHIFREQSPKYDAKATTLGTKFVFFKGGYSIAPYFVTFTKYENQHIFRGHSPKYDAIATTLGTKSVIFMGGNGAGPSARPGAEN